MLEQVTAFVLKYKFILLFYAVILIFVIVKRKKFEFQAKIIALYRMKWGLAWMDKYSTKFREWVILLGYIGAGIGFIGMIFISYFLVKNLITLFTTPAAASGVSLVLPGMNIPGLGILPFWHWLIAIFVIAIVHEFSHGIVARAHNIEVKNTGIVFFGPIIGAFVEPDEKKMAKEKDITQYSVLAAGAFSNVLLALVALLLLTQVTTPLTQSMVEPEGFTFDAYITAATPYPFEAAGIPTGTIITGLNNQNTKTFEEFHTALATSKPGEQVIINTNEKDYTITLASSPDEPGKGFLGISSIHNEATTKAAYQTGFAKVGYYITDTLNTFFRWLFLLSLGIGLFNLLPLPIVDGGRMAQVFLHKLKGKEKGEKRFRQISLFFVLVLILSLIYPFLAKIFTA